MEDTTDRANKEKLKLTKLLPGDEETREWKLRCEVIFQNRGLLRLIKSYPRLRDVLTEEDWKAYQKAVSVVNSALIDAVPYHILEAFNNTPCYAVLVYPDGAMEVQHHSGDLEDEGYVPVATTKGKMSSYLSESVTEHKTPPSHSVQDQNPNSGAQATCTIGYPTTTASSRAQWQRGRRQI